MKSINFLIIFLVLGQSLMGQDIPANVDLGEKNPYPFLTSILLEVSKSAERGVEEGVQKATEFFMPLKEQSIYVEIIRGSENDLDLRIEESFLQTIPNIEISTIWQNRASVWIRVDELMYIGQSLPIEYRLSHVITPAHDNEGPGLMNSDSYDGASAGGDGLIIAVIDSGFDMLTEARNAGAAPTAGNTSAFNYTGTGIENGTQHGTGCLETVFDSAPNAEYYIFKTNSVSDLGTAVTVCINNDIDVITHSISRYNLGWGDNSGAACSAAANASNNGILFFTSSGNRNGTHWQGSFSDSDNDDWHQWSGLDERNNFDMNGTASNTSTIRARLQWNSASSTDHYDLFLYNGNTNTVIQSSTNTNAFEEIIYSINSNLPVYLAVKAVSANPPQFELFNHDARCDDFQYSTTSNSSTSPSNSTASNVISVGAVALTDYNSAAGTSGIIASYSSRGPTNTGNQAPDICAPTNTNTVAYGGGFSGTSCSTPNAAGAAAAFWSAHPDLSASGVRQILFAKADIYKDWGSNGADNLYGRGGLFLYDYNLNNRYILKSANNIFSAATLPYFSMNSVDDSGSVPDNKIMIYLDTADDPPGLINKPMLYKSIQGTVIE